MDTAVGKIAVHTVNLRQVLGTADRADIIIRSVTACWALFHFCITIIFLYLIDRKVL